MIFVRLFSLLAVACICLCAQHGRFAITMKSGPNLKDHPVMMSAIGNASALARNDPGLLAKTDPRHRPCREPRRGASGLDSEALARGQVAEPLRIAIKTIILPERAFGADDNDRP